MHRLVRRLIPRPLLFKPYMEVPTGVVRPRLDSEGDEIDPSRKKQRTEIFTHSRRKKTKVPKRDREVPDKYSSEGVLWNDIVSLLGKDHVENQKKIDREFDSPFFLEQIVEVKIVSLCSTGEAIGLVVAEKSVPWPIVTRFGLPGETVRVKVYWNRRLHSYARLLQVVAPNLELRDNSRVKCKYFGQCGGCQYQMLSYDHQLRLKRNAIAKAYQTLSDLPEYSIPLIGETIPSPLQYGYRTKLTPHFDAPPKLHRMELAEVKDGVVEKPEWLNIGFSPAGAHKVLDIEECPIATPTINAALPVIRKDIFRSIHRHSRGVTLTMRDSLFRPGPEPESSSDAVDGLSTSLEQHVCISDPKGTIREKVGEWVFEYNASSFFQNNNSIVQSLTEYVRDAIFSPSSTLKSSEHFSAPTHLVDAYCGAGLFSITLSPHFERIVGIELSIESIKAAEHNARLNNIPPSKITFRAGDAGDLFFSVKKDFEPSETVLLVDPPRSGCDEQFLEQVLDFRCGTIVYVSCNVSTQARDVGVLVNSTKDDGAGRRYVVESLRGFDLFPQTAHVESVAVLRLV